MEDKNNAVRISELPEITDLLDTDVILHENYQKTSKVTLVTLAEFVKKHIEKLSLFIKRTEINSPNGIAPLNINKKILAENIPFGKEDGQVYKGSEGKALETSVNAHIVDTQIHVTDKDKTKWNKAEPNKIDVIKLNGVELKNDEKSINITGLALEQHTHTQKEITDFPILGTASGKDISESGNAADTQVVMGNDTRLTDARKASDVYPWAKEQIKPSYTKEEVNLGLVDNTSDLEKPVSIAQQKAIDVAYANSNAYTDTKIAELINGAPTTMDTLKEISDAMIENKTVVETLKEAIGDKANEVEFNSHVNDNIVHITNEERKRWNNSLAENHSHENKMVLDEITHEMLNALTDTSNKLDKTGDASSVITSFSPTSSRTNLVSGETLSVSLGKVMKWFSDLKPVALSGKYSDLTNKPIIPSKVSELTNDKNFVIEVNSDTEPSLSVGEYWLQEY